MKTLMLNCREEQRRCHRHPWMSMPDGLAAPLVFNATDQTSGPVICSYKTGWGSQGQGVRGDIMDRSAGLASGCFSFSSTQCRSLLLSFSTCYLGILGLEGAINCILAQTSHQRTTSEERTKAMLPKCSLFRASTVYQGYLSLNPGVHSLAVFPGRCHSSTRPDTSYHVTQFYQDKRWGEKAWVRGYTGLASCHRSTLLLLALLLMLELG